ncbi:hypothetical protein UA08_01720 [Talaromyces atroroseus]|uniref:Uncharacterized protein n=1 Tax=Talaromyces atroroseus TaxID=1441469 RepID=A0A1Q5QA88_TALAT|nr:hypothetical protein UA08_01720 [Talaromyces atroroseus]OKL62854.1 hypothetical protein UA08_01720 [Talaromyces atroroseus]
MDLQVRRIISFTEDVAVGLRPFRERLPEYSAEITNVIADLYAISATLTSLEGLARQFPRNYGHVIKPDLERTLASLRYTLNEIISSFGRIDGRPTADNYRRVWHDLDSYFHEEDGYSLKRRLTKYKLFLQELQDVMQKYTSNRLLIAYLLINFLMLTFPIVGPRSKRVDAHFMAELRKNILRLLEEQDSRFTAHLASLSLSPTGSSMNSSIVSGSSQEGHGVGKRRSYERARPGFRPHPAPLHSPASSHEGPPPWVPEVPVSPISTSTTTQSNISSAILNDHWAKDVFAYKGPGIKFRVRGESSKCLGEEVQPDIKDWLDKEGFDEVAYLPFDENQGSAISVFFYVREGDNRVRILSNRISEMVSFFCTFLALRSQDNHRPVQDIRDFDLAAEEEMFGGPIIDDNHMHALRIYRDRVSGAIRLQASIHEGSMKRTPVWTAFITGYIDSSYWIRRNNSKVFLRELHRVIFSPEYRPSRTSRGEHVLQFTSESGV